MGRRELLRVDAKVEVEYKNFDQFYQEYTKNISKGGLFIKTRNVLKPQTVLDISLKLPGRSEPLVIAGEVVHVIEPDNPNNWPPGMGIQFVDFEEGSHQELEAYVASQYQQDPEARTIDRRKHSRAPIRMRVKFPNLEVLQQDYSEDISKGGIFIQTGKPRQVGDRFLITLVHPESGEELELLGEVVRLVKPEVSDPKKKAGMGIKFMGMDEKKKRAIDMFLGLDLPANG